MFTRSEALYTARSAVGRHEVVVALLFRSAGTLLLPAEVSFDYRMPCRSVRKKRAYFKNLDKAHTREMPIEIIVCVIPKSEGQR